jgi:hypothetical protein
MLIVKDAWLTRAHRAVGAGEDAAEVDTGEALPGYPTIIAISV